MCCTEYRFGINAVVLEMLMAGQVIEFPISMWRWRGLALPGCVGALEYGLLHLLERSPTAQSLKTTRKFGMLAILSLLTCNSMHVWAAAHAYQPITQIKRYLPLFYPATSNSTMHEIWLGGRRSAGAPETADRTKAKQRFALARSQPLQVTAVEKPVNLVFLVIQLLAGRTPQCGKHAQLVEICAVRPHAEPAHVNG